MAQPSLSDEVLLDTLKIYALNNQNSVASAAMLGLPRATFINRLHRAQQKFPKMDFSTHPQVTAKWTFPAMKHIESPKSVWIIGSDFHLWDDQPTLIYKAFAKLARELKVTGIIANGDVLDGARVSRHGLPMGTKAPKIDKEIDAARKLFSMLPRTKYRLWTMGNHDIRIDNYIAGQARELDEYIGNLATRFPEWDIAYAFTLNDHTEVRHRFRGGIHGGYNNALHSGVNLITGHTHQLQVTAIRDRKGSRWGVETGTMADPKGPQFEYTEGAPTRAQMGFAVITFDADGHMLPPELCEIIRGRPVFRGRYVL